MSSNDLNIEKILSIFFLFTISMRARINVIAQILRLASGRSVVVACTIVRASASNNLSKYLLISRGILPLEAIVLRMILSNLIHDEMTFLTIY